MRRMMTWVCFLLCALALVALWVEHPLMPRIFGTVSLAIPGVLIALGASRRGRIARLWWFVLGFTALLEICFWSMVLLSSSPATAPGQLPLGAMIMLGGLFALPLVIVPLVYMVDFDRGGISQQDLQRLREIRDRVSEPGGSD